MLTVIISVVVFVLAILEPHVKYMFQNNFGKWGSVIVLGMLGLEIGILIACFIPEKYEISKCDVYYISDDKPINIQTTSKEITFFREEVDGKTISMDIKVDSLTIEHTSDKNSIEVITYVRTNKFAVGGPKVKANVFMSSNPHHWCGFF